MHETNWPWTGVKGEAGVSVLGDLFMVAGPQASHPLKYVVRAGTASL